MKKIFLLLLFLFTIQPVFAFQAVQSTDSLTTFIFVRHAEKVDDGTSNPPLSNTGLERANRLKEVLADYPINNIYSTTYHRTRQTATPIAEIRNLDIIEYGFDDPVKLLQNIIDKQPGQFVLIVGHSNTTPILVNILLGEKQYEFIEEDDYSNIYVVKASGVGSAEVEHLTY